MNIFIYISNLIIPFSVVLIVMYGFKKGINVYESFVKGAKDGCILIFDVLPTMVGLMLAVSIIRSSGLLTLLENLFTPISNLTGFPKELIPLSFMRMISASGAVGIIIDIFKTYGPDSFIGRTASTMMSCTETIFYTMSLYFMSIGIKNTRYTLKGSILSNIAGIIASLFIVSIVFGK